MDPSKNTFSSEMKEAFKIISHSKSKVMAQSKLQSLLKSFGMYLSKEDCDNLFSNYLDTQNKGSMDFVDFCNFMYDIFLSAPDVAESDKEALLQQQFAKLDVEKKGYITREDLKKASSLLGRAFEPEELEQIFEQFGQETQQITYSMYKQLLTS